MSIPPDDDTRYVIECDLIYPEQDYPLAPANLTVNFEMLSPFAAQFIDREWKSSKN